MLRCYEIHSRCLCSIVTSHWNKRIKKNGVMFKTARKYSRDYLINFFCLSRYPGTMPHILKWSERHLKVSITEFLHHIPINYLCYLFSCETGRGLRVPRFIRARRLAFGLSRWGDIPNASAWAHHCHLLLFIRAKQKRNSSHKGLISTNERQIRDTNVFGLLRRTKYKPPPPKVWYQTHFFKYLIKNF